MRSLHTGHPRARRRRLAILTALLVCVATAWIGSPAATAAPAAGPVSPALVTTTAHPGNQVALTFDDGPSPQYTPQLLQVLRKHQVKAVFCLVGEQVEWQQAQVRAIVADGHTLCNHTYRHRDLTAVSPAEIEADIKQTDAQIRAAVPGVEIPYFRAPYGNWGQSPAVAANLGLRPLSWTLMPGDWELPGTDVLLQRLRDGITPTGVVTLHDAGGDRQQTVDAVDRLIPEFKAKGWNFDLPAR
ncbi:polysaccharide deacetylase family protein [Embleya hyalina]|uniref:Oligosaccharide deacetylase n=1 Tax=Embleya hyalina TaxID=516124 RepID=A0A401YVB3_9ACTN|nr:polysaccharide deacetylase family protein [Embleya hyalina]GCD98530.1 oligosaccharide deacetylase [Embleya hyalina]